MRKVPGPSIKAYLGYKPARGFTGLHLNVDTATVCADLLASLGNDRAAEIILQLAAS